MSQFIDKAKKEEKFRKSLTKSNVKGIKLEDLLSGKAE